MKAILALGNPGRRYLDTRHNVGWWLADRLVVRWRTKPFQPVGRALRSGATIGGAAVEILKPLTYVNRSGEVVADLLRTPQWDVRRDMLLLVDDVGLEPGAIRLRARGSTGGHRGLASVEEIAGTDKYCRLRIGVGRSPDPAVDLATWVLSPMSHGDEERVLGALDVGGEAVECWVREGIEAAMSRYNQTAF